MRITGIRARNFLSWKELEVSGINDMEIWVGPNGAGKSNLGQIIQVVETAVQTLLSGSSMPLGEDYQSEWDSQGRVEAAIRCVWDTDAEMPVLATMLRATVAHAEEISRALELPDALQVDAKRWNAYFETIGERFTVAEFSSGWLGVRWYDGPRGDVLLFYELKDERDLPVFWILGPTMAGYLTRELPDTLPSAWGGTAATRVYHQQLDASEKGAVRAYLSGETDILPDLPFCSTTTLLDGAQPHAVELMVHPTLPGNNELTIPFVRSARLLNLPLESTQRVLGDRVFKQIIRSKLTTLRNWRTQPRELYSLEELASRHPVLSDGQDLALYLLRLKTGNRKQRERFKVIQERFRRVLPDKSLDVELSFLDGQSEADAKVAMVRMVVERNGRSVSLLRSGAGTIELAIMTIVLSAPHDSVVFMDEPGANLHPRTQRSLLQYLRTMQAQRILITHSPYLLAPDLLPQIRRAFMEDQQSQLFSCEAANDGKEAADEPIDRKLEQMLRRDTDIISMVFASCVLLVEGETELGALPLWFERTYGVGLDELNILIYSVGGKDNFGTVLRYLKSLHIPWVLLCDGDALDRSKGRNGRTLLTQLTNLGIGTEEVQNQGFDKQVRWLSNIGAFVSGSDYEGKFETVPEIVEAVSKAPPGTKPQRGHWLAENVQCPAYLFPVFEAIRTRAQLVNPTRI